MIEAGKKVRCLRNIGFCDGTFHKKNEIYTIGKDEIPYYSMFIGRDYIMEDDDGNRPHELVI